MSIYTDTLIEYSRVEKRIDNATVTKKDIDALNNILKRCNRYIEDYKGSLDGDKWKALAELTLYATIEVKQVIALNKRIRQIEREIA